MIEVLIGVQARSTSKRLPGKSLEIIDETVMVDHVLTATKLCANYFNNRKQQFNISVTAALLVPFGDPIKEAMAGNLIIEGPEDDVLTRYKYAVQRFMPDYICRVTGDCPMILPTILTKHIIAAADSDLDYCSNSYDETRTYIDGMDTEIISRKLFDWVDQNATSKSHREHCTTLIKEAPPKWAKFGVVIGHVDLSDIKLSVDTKEELEAVRKNKESIKAKIELAKSKNYSIFRF